MNNLSEILIPYMFYKETGVLTSVWIAGLQISFFIFFLYLLIKIYIVRRSINKVINNFAENNISNNKYLKNAWLSYQNHFIDLNNNSKKTYNFAEQYFGTELIERIFNIDLWKSIPGMFVGLGILGTFAGLCMGLSGFNFSSSKLILSSIQVLMDGIKTAFLTSLYGISFSIIFGIFENISFHKMNKAMQNLCIFLNEKYKLTQNDEIQIKQEQKEYLFHRLEESLNKHQKEIKQIFINEIKLNRSEINNHLSDEFNKAINILRNDSRKYFNELFVADDDHDNNLYPANIFRDLLRESEEQSKALKAFSTDLADIIMERLEGMSTKSILPEFKKIISSCESLESSIKSFALTTGQDIGKELKEIIFSLQNSLKKVMEDFREAFTSGAMQQLNKVVEALNESAKIMEDLPLLLKQMILDIKQTSNEDSIRRRQEEKKEFDKFKNNFRDAVGLILKNVNEIEIQRTNGEFKRQKQIKTEFENMIKAFKYSIDSIIKNLSSAEQKQIDREQILLDQVNKNLSNAVKQIENINKVQESYTKQIKMLLSSTGDVVKDEKDLLIKINDHNELMVAITQNFNSISSDLRNNTGNIKSSIKYLNSSIQSFKEQFDQLTEFNETTFKQIGDSLSENEKILKEYVEKFEIIKSGLIYIFRDIETGLRKYSSAVKNGINEYLSGFTSQLSTASEKLAGSIEALNDLFEEISDKLEEN